MAVCMRRLTISGFQGRDRPCGHILYAFLILNEVKTSALGATILNRQQTAVQDDTGRNGTSSFIPVRGNIIREIGKHPGRKGSF